MPASTPISPTVGLAEGVSIFSGQGVGLQRSSCRSATAYAISRLRSDIDYWYDNTGSKIQQQIQAHTIKTLSDVKLDFDVADLSTSYSAEHPNDYSFPNSLHNLLKAKDT